MPVSQITNIAPAGQFPSKHGVNGIMYSSSVTFADGTTGQANHKQQTPPYRVGDFQEYTITGDYNGVAKLKVQRPHVDPQTTRQATPPVQSGYRPAPTYQPPQQNAATGQGSPAIHGATAGMAIKAALDLAVGVGLKPHQPDFWPAVHEYASDICRLSWKLEHGQLAAKQGQRNAPPAAQPAPHPAPQYAPPQAQQQRPQPGPGGSAFPDGSDEDVPF